MFTEKHQAYKFVGARRYYDLLFVTMTKITDPDPPALQRSLSLLPEPLSSPERTQHATDDLPYREQSATYLRDHREKAITWPPMLTHRRNVLSKWRHVTEIKYAFTYLNNTLVQRETLSSVLKILQVQIQAVAHNQCPHRTGSL